MAERKYKNPQVNLRLPEELKQKVAVLAEKHKRSANAEMVAAIEHWVAEYDLLESRQETLNLMAKNPSAREQPHIRDLLNDFVAKVTPLLEEEMHRREEAEKNGEKNNNPT
ncbi:hypothetical protein CIL06_11480 [Pantoea vagans]|uniref:Arc family DNA-binding protein n=1 Tax=Pantoea vagans TaxID=470934 RepID=UPI000BACC0D4|nr:Arc family DNA-binding protein [Pantoea vagans]PAW36286.1 hypothetical protein CIL06_11480 [Pantoea vagans]